VTLSPSRITLARQRAGLTKVQLAERLGATARTISNYERTGAPQRVLADLSTALGFPRAFFSRPGSPGIETEQIFFRARRRTTSVQKHAAAALGRIGVELYDYVTQPFGLPALDLPDLSAMDSQSAAKQLRIDWNLGLAPLPNLIRLVESRGVRVLSLPDAEADVDAFSFWDQGLPFMFLSTLKSAERSRFDVAHELGHLTLHAGLGQNPNDIENAEREADEFASALLMPRSELRARVPREPSFNQVLSLKKHFGVSAMALVYSSHKAEILSDWTYRLLMQELAEKGFRHDEPGGMPRETSHVFATVLPALRTQHGKGIKDIVGDLGLKTTEIRGLTFGQALLPVPGGQVGDKSLRREQVHLRAL